MDAGGVRTERCKPHIDAGHHQIGQEVDVLKMPRFYIKTCVDPNSSERSVLHREHCALAIVRRLRIEKLWIPMLACPGSFAFRAEERGGFSKGRLDDEFETGLSVH